MATKKQTKAAAALEAMEAMEAPPPLPTPQPVHAVYQTRPKAKPVKKKTAAEKRREKARKPPAPPYGTPPEAPAVAGIYGIGRTPEQIALSAEAKREADNTARDKQRQHAKDIAAVRVAQAKAKDVVQVEHSQLQEEAAQAAAELQRQVAEAEHAKLQVQTAAHAKTLRKAMRDIDGG